MPSIDFFRLRSQVSIAQVLALIDYAPTRQRGRQWRGPCPIHGSHSPKSRSFSINTERNIFRCFKCGAQGNQLDLWMAITDLPLYEATVDLCEKLSLDIPRQDA